MLPWHRLARISKNFFRGANCHHKRPLHHQQHHHWLGLRALCRCNGSYLVYFYLTTFDVRWTLFFFLRPASSVVVQRDARKHPGIELNSSMAKYPLPVDFRWEDYLRLRFVDDQCLRTAMQGFLKGEISRKARLTRRETPFSKCQ